MNIHFLRSNIGLRNIGLSCSRHLGGKSRPGTNARKTLGCRVCKGHATRNDIVDDIVDVSSSTMAFNVAKIASARASLTISLTKSLRVAGPLVTRSR